MGSSLIILAQDVEQEEVDIIVQGLVVQEQLCQVAQVLAVELLLLPINLQPGITFNPNFLCSFAYERCRTFHTFRTRPHLPSSK